MTSSSMVPLVIILEALTLKDPESESDVTGLEGVEQDWSRHDEPV